MTFNSCGEIQTHFIFKNVTTGILLTRVIPTQSTYHSNHLVERVINSFIVSYSSDTVYGSHIDGDFFLHRDLN